MGPEPVLVVDLGEQRADLARLDRRPVRRPHRSRGPERQARRTGGRRRQDARARHAGPTRPTGRFGRWPRRAAPKSSWSWRSSLPNTFSTDRSPSWRGPSPDATFFPAASASVRLARCTRPSARSGPGSERAGRRGASAGVGRRRQSRRKAAAETTRKVDRTLVLCTLFGGNDGLNTVDPLRELRLPPAARTYRDPRRPGAAARIGRRRQARTAPVDGRSEDPLGCRPGRHHPRRRLPEPELQPLPVDGDHADRRPVGRQPPAVGSGAGSTRPARTRCAPCRSARHVPQVFAGARQQASTLADSDESGFPATRG